MCVGEREREGGESSQGGCYCFCFGSHRGAIFTWFPCENLASLDVRMCAKIEREREFVLVCE